MPTPFVFVQACHIAQARQNCATCQIAQVQKKGRLTNCAHQDLELQKKAAYKLRLSSADESTAVNNTCLSRVRSHVRSQPHEEPIPQTMHALSHLIGKTTVCIQFWLIVTWHQAVLQYAATAVRPPAIVAAPNQEVGVTDLTVTSDWTIPLRKLDRANKGHG